MIDCENEVYTKVATALRAEFSGINISGEYQNTPSAFPHVCFTQSDNAVVKRYTDDNHEMAHVMFEVNVYSNKASGKKTECKKIMKSIDAVMFSINFRRTALTPVPNMENASIYRLTARYEGLSDGKFFYRS